MTRIRFGESDFPAESIEYVRQLANGEVVTCGRSYAESNRRRILEGLRSEGFAKYSSPGRKDRYKASAELLRQRDIHDARRPLLSFQELADKMGRDVSPRTVKTWIRRFRPSRVALYRQFPTVDEVHLQLPLQEEVCPHALTRNTPTEPGDVAGFSSPALTYWYVQRFLTLNKLKGDAPCK